MQRIDTPTAVNGMFVNGNPNEGILATRLNADWFNSVQEELCNLIEILGNSELDKENRRQLLDTLIGVSIFSYERDSSVSSFSIPENTKNLAVYINDVGTASDLTVTGTLNGFLIVFPSYSGYTGNLVIGGVKISLYTPVIVYRRRSSGGLTYVYKRIGSYVSHITYFIQPINDRLPLIPTGDNPPDKVILSFSVEEGCLVEVNLSGMFDRRIAASGSVNPSRTKLFVVNPSGTTVAEAEVTLRYRTDPSESWLSFCLAFESVSSGTYSVRLACQEPQTWFNGGSVFVKQTAI